MRSPVGSLMVVLITLTQHLLRVEESQVWTVLPVLVKPDHGDDVNNIGGITQGDALGLFWPSSVKRQVACNRALKRC